MLFKNISIGGTVLLVFSLTSCATIKDNLGIEPPEMSSTAMGAATGTAIGATAGAIIGSTSGNAGEGIILGGGLGAVSGAVVGSELGEQEQEYASHQNTLNNQEQEIKLQNKKLDRLRGSSFDTSRFDNNGRFVISEANRSSKGGYAKSGSYRQYAKNDNIKNDYASAEPLASQANQLRARLTPPSPKPVAFSLPKTKTVLASGGEKISAPASSALKSTAMPAADIKAVSAVVDSKIAVDKKIAEAKKEPIAKAVTETKSVDNGGSCSEAESEAKRARTAATDTDKIFYYRRALRLCKTKPEYHVEMGKVYSSIGRKEEAEFEFSKALEIDPDNRDAQDELTLLMLDSSN